MRLLLITRYICFIQILLRENDARARVEFFFSIIVGTAVGAATAAVRVLEGQYIQEHRNPLRGSGQPMGPLGPCGTRSKHCTAGLVQTYSRACTRREYVM